ncbi:MAG TPA: hypothetical protein VJS92_09060 [Candidatus Polarisedimenticolaceae bacterium]|nr:hypothetical protein [Candidatus Polarisedimenticolaceae bacterium]
MNGTLVLTALPEELAPLAARTQVVVRERIARCRVHRGSLAGRPIVLASTGEGRSCAQRGAAALIERFAPERVLVLGVSGGLTPGLAPGDLLVAGQVWAGTAPVPPPDRRWVEHARGRRGTMEAMVVSTDRILCTPAEKTALRHELAADARPAAVDLESAAYAWAAAARGVPYVVVRSILDPAEEALPLDLNLCLTADGRVDRARVAGRLLLHPRNLGLVWNLRQRLRSCARRLAELVEELLNSAPVAADGAALDAGGR